MMMKSMTTGLMTSVPVSTHAFPIQWDFRDISEFACGSDEDDAEEETESARTAGSVGFADGTNEGPSKRLMRQQTGIGETETVGPMVGFAEDTRSQPSKKLVRQQTGGPGVSVPDSDEQEDEEEDEATASDEEVNSPATFIVAPLPPMLRSHRSLKNVARSVGALNKLQADAKSKGPSSTPLPLDHVVPAVAVAAVEKVVEALEGRMDDLKADMRQVRETLAAAIVAAQAKQEAGRDRP